MEVPNLGEAHACVPPGSALPGYDVYKSYKEFAVHNSTNILYFCYIWRIVRLFCIHICTCFIFFGRSSSWQTGYYTLCMIFTILVSFSRDNTLFASKAKINFFLKFQTEQLWRGQWSEKMFQKTLLLAFEVIVQPPIAHFLTFSSETKIMKITHRQPGRHAFLWIIQNNV